MAKKTSRKSVSFQPNESEVNSDADAPGSHSESGKNAGSGSANIEYKTKVPTLAYPIIPVQNLFLVWDLFRRGLTEHIAETLLNSLPTVAVLSAAQGYLITLASANSGKKSKKQTNVPLLIVGSVFMSFVLSVPLFGAILLFGAPLASHLTETFLLAVHLSFLIFNPLLVLFKFDLDAFVSVFKAERIYRLIFGNYILASSLVAVAGVWIGVIPIPLDWDRPWQQWPITLLVGGYVGSVVGGALSVLF
ncbi:hypothetical protein G9P44_001936 [Scheffersomyces stipitis]|nr:hypothetical protein G9P44_001936 [Scheffersomyces stipitis]